MFQFCTDVVREYTSTLGSRRTYRIDVGSYCELLASFTSKKRKWRCNAPKRGRNYSNRKDNGNMNVKQTNQELARTFCRSGWLPRSLMTRRPRPSPAHDRSASRSDPPSTNTNGRASPPFGWRRSARPLGTAPEAAEPLIRASVKPQATQRRCSTCAVPAPSTASTTNRSSARHSGHTAPAINRFLVNLSPRHSWR